MRPPKDTELCKLYRDPAPEQHAEPGDFFMEYGITINDEPFGHTDDYSPKELAKMCRDASAWLLKVARYLDRKKYDGRKCN